MHLSFLAKVALLHLLHTCRSINPFVSNYVHGYMRVIKNMYEASRSAILLEGEKSAAFRVEQGVAQECSLSPILFSVFINGLLKDVEEAGLGIEISSGKRMGGMLFADDFVGVSELRKAYRSLSMLYIGTVTGGD